jgi:hypothetical protein
LQIDHEFEFDGLLDRKLGRLGAAQNAPGIYADLAVRLGNIGPVAHQAACLRPFARLEHRRNRMARCQRDDLDHAGGEEIRAALNSACSVATCTANPARQRTIAHRIVRSLPVSLRSDGSLYSATL